MYSIKMGRSEMESYCRPSQFFCQSIFLLKLLSVFDFRSSDLFASHPLHPQSKTGVENQSHINVGNAW